MSLKELFENLASASEEHIKAEEALNNAIGKLKKAESDIYGNDKAMELLEDTVVTTAFHSVSLSQHEKLEVSKAVASYSLSEDSSNE